ncbi:unnamed protein product [Staurois parvus]|uniref:THAP-type domain-containing protein n=1 Tax=Staurois parvus TaxID=386267 RepID=A0ABN9FIR2_9NEOB|nr:unnamed protein product [Staurois parvus]
MTVCAMFGCKNRMHKGCGKHFFRFPMKDPERLLRWIEAVQRDDWKPSVHSKVCSDHFTENDYMIRPGAACPYLRTDAVPKPLFTQRKKKTKKRKCTKNSASGAPVSNEMEGEMQVEEDQSESQMIDHPVEDLVMQDAAAPSEETQEPPKQDQTPATEPQSKEKEAEKPDMASGAAEMDSTQEKGAEVQTHGGEYTAETQSQEQIETCGPAMAEEAEKQILETRGKQPPRHDRMAEIDDNITTQNERQVALILAELEDTHCEMRAAEARAAREAASNHNQCSDENMSINEAASSNSQSSSDNPADYIPFDHAYTTLTMSNKENDIPASSPAPVLAPALASASAPTPVPNPIVNPKIVKLRKKIKTLQKQVLRQGVKIKGLKQTLVELRRNNLSEKDPERVISEHCSGLALALFTTQLKNHRKYSAMQYCNLLKDFALSLYQTSPKAYKFCRLFLSLPHPVSLRHWKTSLETNQGALQEVIMQAEAEQGEDPQGEVSQEDILAGALKAVALQSETGREEELQNEALPETQTQ